jgi:hypothetical protein
LAQHSIAFNPVDPEAAAFATEILFGSLLDLQERIDMLLKGHLLAQPTQRASNPYLL